MRKDKHNKKIHPKNKLNNLTGKEWLQFQKSWFLFNALPSDLKEEREIIGNSTDHPATFSPTMISEFIKFFTKPGEIVLDPFLGIGSTLVACDRTKRKGIGIELVKKYAEMAKKRTKQKIITGDARDISKMNLPKIDYCITSPPYWNILNRSTGEFKKTRASKGLPTKYSDLEKDIGNIKEYYAFIDVIYNIFSQIYNILREGKYVTIIVKNIKKKGKLYPLAWDIARRLGELYELKDERIWIQDKVRLYPFGYPYAWTSNIIHHYCLNFQKRKVEK
ncbi:MAG: DNA methyltransferase [Candidatus Humimicrobiia bacterium]